MNSKPPVSSRKSQTPKTPRASAPASASAPSNGRAANGRTVVAVLMQLQSDVKVFHWRTHSFAAHKAADELHATLIDKIDQFVEQFMGRHGRVGFGARGVTLKLHDVSTAQFSKILRTSAGFLVKSLPNSLASNDVDLLTLRDDILGAIRKTQYLMTLK